jgi:uncharacterized protein YndB with AHSA1/START domain
MTDRAGTEAGGDVTSLRIVRILPAPPEVVFDAWLDPEAIRVWMCPGDIFESVAEIDASEGGEFTIVMPSPGMDDPHTGEYRVIDRPRQLQFTWSSASTYHQPTLVNLDFAPHGDNECELTLTHAELPPDKVEIHTVGWKGHIRVMIDLIEGDTLPGA